ncbi:hypothetical protein BC829DRAFT_404660 [Chytridium lagenaria]|nr:hypothetical protein BC829DRAFT_404660 [Chytridium lagenaria]
MTMNYGPSHAPNGKTGMGGYAISAAGKTREQLQLIGLNAKIGITPMIGQNDVGSEVFRQEDAAAIARWAKGSSYVSFIGMWSANRDNSKFTTDANSTLAASSLVKQEDGEFGRTLLSFET